MTSIERRLIASIVAASLVLSAATAALLYRSVRADLLRQFDRSLGSQAEALTSLVTIDPAGKLDFEFNADAMPGYQRRDHAAYYVIRFDDGRVFAASPSWGAAQLSDVPPGETAVDVRLPRGAAGRALRLGFVPQLDIDGNSATQPAASARAVPGMTITVFRERGSLDQALARLRRTLAIGTGLLAVALAAVTAAIVRISLRPVRALADRAQQIDSSRLHLRFDTVSVPGELVPITHRLNDLLERLDAAFTRERRFTADVAHELRTPIAELRSLTEVVLRWPDDAGAALHAVREAHDIAAQLQALVATLLSLVRSESATSVELSAVPLRPLVAATVEEGESAVGRAVDVDVPEEATVLAEPTLLASVLRNVLANALEYSVPRSPVRCRAWREDERWVLAVENEPANLSPFDLPHLFEPFWRKDAARSDSLHAGLGLSLVSAYCRLMDATVRATMMPPATLRLEIRFQSLPAMPASTPETRPSDVATATTVR